MRFDRVFSLSLKEFNLNVNNLNLKFIRTDDKRVIINNAKGKEKNRFY